MSELLEIAARLTGALGVGGVVVFAYRRGWRDGVQAGLAQGVRYALEPRRLPVNDNTEARP
jgi:hypothetical protein